jgi:hypothetical protein
VVVPGGGVLTPVPPPPPLLQLTPAATTTTSRTANGTSFHRLCLGTLTRIRKQITETDAPTSGQLRPPGRLDGRYRPLVAVVEQVIVELPVPFVVNVMVTGANVHTGK